jgi:methylamine dehydrogenase accessory protein MauD
MSTILIVSQVLLWIVVALVAFACLALARQVGLLFERVAPVGALTTQNGPAVGSAAPRLSLAALDGRTVALGGPSSSGRSRLLMFVSSDCPICRKLIPLATRVATAEALDLIFAGDDELRVQEMTVSRYDIGRYPFINSRELGMAYGIDKLPYAILIDQHGIIVSRGLVNSREHLESLVEARDTGFSSVQHFLETRKRRDQARPEQSGADQGRVA